MSGEGSGHPFVGSNVTRQSEVEPKVGKQSVRQEARRAALGVQVQRRAQRAARDRQLEGLAVQALTAMGEREAAIAEAEQRAGCLSAAPLGTCPPTDPATLRRQQNNCGTNSRGPWGTSHSRYFVSPLRHGRVVAFVAGARLARRRSSRSAAPSTCPYCKFESHNATACQRAAMAQVGTATAYETGTHWRRNLWVCVGGSFPTIVGMTLLVPFLPLYVRELGASTDAEVLRWSGIAYGAPFFTAALTAPLWGVLGDRYGRKSMLIRASLGMTVAMSLIGLAQTVWQLVALRLLVGLLGGYSSAATILVAAQAPKERSGWALGVLSSGIMAGAVVGPLLGGVLPEVIGIRRTFFFTGALIFCAFLSHDVPAQGRRHGSAEGSDGQRHRRGRCTRLDDHPLCHDLADHGQHAHVRHDVHRAARYCVRHRDQRGASRDDVGRTRARSRSCRIDRISPIHRPEGRSTWLPPRDRRLPRGCSGLRPGPGLCAKRSAARASAAGPRRLPWWADAIGHGRNPPRHSIRSRGTNPRTRCLSSIRRLRSGPVTGGLVAGAAGFRSVFAITASVLLLAAAMNVADERLRRRQSR